jgi:hypothetical protein
MSIVQNMFLAALAALLFATPASAKTICSGGELCYGGSGKRIHYAQQPAVQEGWASNRWGWVPYHWRFGDHYFDGI